MATASHPSPNRISLSELDTVLEQARAEGWRELALIGPQGHWQQPKAHPRRHSGGAPDRAGGLGYWQRSLVQSRVVQSVSEAQRAP
jgi:hypothetical protein